MMVRPLKLRDAKPWGEMRARLWPEADADQLMQEATAFASGRANTLLAAVFVADADKTVPIGFIEVSIRPFSDGCESTPVPHVEGWYVEPAQRGHGVGRELMKAAESWAREQGFGELASDSEIDNAASLRAHEALRL